MNRWVLYFCIGMIIVFGVDIALVETGNQSISLTTWLAEQAHPMIIAGVLLVGGWLSFAAMEGAIDAAFQTQPTWGYKGMSFTIALGTGHLITSEGAAIAKAMATTSRWTHAPTWQWWVIGAAILAAIVLACLLVLRERNNGTEQKSR